MHEDEEIRYVLDGSGFFDVRGGFLAISNIDMSEHETTEHPTNSWVRIHVVPGDLLVVPAGIYHRFSLDSEERIKVLRLFKVRLRVFCWRIEMLLIQRLSRMNPSGPLTTEDQTPIRTHTGWTT